MKNMKYQSLVDVWTSEDEEIKATLDEAIKLAKKMWEIVAKMMEEWELETI